ncbi:MAG: hypothetical protein E6Q34_08640 [Burkholderiaceae bacterium]|nr:MAG: hypothetical protein E6Q34_08640 [Burkholderiaceae bacterium]
MRNVVYVMMLMLAICSPSKAFTLSIRDSSETGLWVGKLGDQQVWACLTMSKSRAILQGSHYVYQKHLKPIALRQMPGDAGQWEEFVGDALTGVWKLEDFDEHELTALWREPMTDKAVKLRLQRFEDLDGSNSECLEAAVTNQLSLWKKITQLKIESGPLLQLSGKRYRRLVVRKMDVSSFEIVDNIPARDAINFRLANQLHSAAIADFDCRHSGGTEGANDASHVNFESSESIEPVYWGDRWLSLVSRRTADCGGPYPYYGFTYSTWDTQVGIKVDLWKWLKLELTENSQLKSNDSSRKLPRGLNDLIIRKAIKARRAINGISAKTDDCVGVLRMNSDYQLHLSAKGMVFSQDFPHVTQACNGAVEISLRELTPYLSEQGRRYFDLSKH